MKGKGLEIIAVAEDAGGSAVSDRHYARAKATFTALFDVNHTVTSLYKMVNVPQGVWIDEEGKIVRPPEVAYTRGFNLLGKQIGDERYVPGLRDWVEHGAESRYVMPKDQLAERLAPRSRDEGLADAHFKLGAYLFEQGDRKLAKTHWQAAQRLAPDNWNYHRQDWSFSRSESTLKFARKVVGLGDKPYYEPLAFPDAPSPGAR